ncbi:MAG: ABC transporter substrate-binding protein [Clostridiales bacterium]|nr:ABC transporter substrate-binding protein [Clostridiales bacterium]
MRRKKFAGILAIALCVAFALSACGGGTTGGGTAPGGSPGGSAPPSGGGATGAAPAYITIGIPTPLTGNIAGFGTGTPYVEQLVVDAVNKDGGIFIKDYNKKIPIKIDVQDSQSDQSKAGQIAEQMATNDHVNMFIAQHTPSNTIPTIEVAERYGIPCVSNGCPSEDVKAVGNLKWTYHAFWDTTDAITQYMKVWDQLNFKAGTVVGFLFPNDPDAIVWNQVAKDLCTQKGYVISDPGQYPLGNTDWTSVINKFKQDKVQIILGNDIAPDYSAFVTQAAQQGFTAQLTTMGRAFLFPSDANALPIEAANGLTCEVWWSPTLPFKSSIDGTTAQQLADEFVKSTNTPYTSALGDKYSAMEICVNAITKAASLDPEKIREALAATDLDTIAGHVSYDQTTHIGVLPVAVGQWVKDSTGKQVTIQVVNRGNFPEGMPVVDPFIPNPPKS